MTATRIGRPSTPDANRQAASPSGQLAPDRSGALSPRTATTRPSLRFNADLQRLQPDPPPSHRPTTISDLHCHLGNAWMVAAISNGGRQLQGCAAAGARADVVLVQPRQYPPQDRQAPGRRRALFSGAGAEPDAIGRRAPISFRP